jgi:cytochrome c oxidase assembly protein Cox11
MFFFGIYNIPIYKLYCEINNYYSFNNLNNFIDNKIYLYKNNHYINNNYLYNISFKDFNFYYNLNNYLNYNKYNININNFYFDLNNYNIYLNFFFLDFIIYNLFNIFFFLFYKIENNINIDSIVYVVYFNTSVTNINIIEFISLQDHIYIYTSETYLVFFRLYNPSNFLIKGISIYTINPNDVNAYIYKIQCFCFDEMVLYSFESIDLPILFYISSNINNYLNFESIFFFQIQIIYLFILNSFKI